MASHRHHSIAQLGASVRDTLAQLYITRDPEFGYLVARRTAFEAVKLVSENNSPRAAYEMILGLGDRVADGEVFDLLEDDPLPPAAWASITEAEIAERVESLPFVDLDPESLGKVMFGGMTFDRAKVIVDAAAEAMAKSRRKELPGWRQALERYAPPWWLVAFFVGLAAGQR